VAGVSESWFYKVARPRTHRPPAPSIRARRRGAGLVRGLGWYAWHLRVAAGVGGPGRRRVGGVEEDGGGVDGAPRPAGPVPDRKRRSLTRPDKAAAPIPDLVGRDFTAEQIDQRWCGDLTEIPTGEGKLYLAIVLDLASRRLPGFALGEHHDSELANAALYMAAAVRGGDVDGVVFTPTRAASTSGTCSRRRAPHSG
jgi:putative transposase